MPEISLCMIVKNEELFLPQCLESVKDAVDEIVIVDTGSTDNTIAMAKKTVEKYSKASLKIHHFPWVDDFSAARNESLKFATKDWILALDADHVLDKGSVPILRELITKEDALAYLVKIFMYTGDADSSEHKGHQGESILFKLFRNNHDIHYRGIIHEQNWPSILNAKKLNPRMNTYESDITVHHYGYTREGYERHKPMERNTRLIEKVLSEEKLSIEENLYYQIHLAELLRIQGKIAEAKKIFMDVMGLLRNQQTPYLFAVPVASVLYTNLTEIFLEEDKPEEARVILELALKYFPKVPTYYYYFGQYYLRVQNYRSASQMFVRCIKFGETRDYDPEISFSISIITYLSYFGLGLSYFNLGAVKNARSAFEKSLELNPDFKLAKDVLSNFK